MVDYTKHAEVRDLLERAIWCFRKEGEERRKDWWIFNEVLGDTLETHDRFYIFLRDVSKCPEEVLDWCRRKIRPRRVV